MKMIDMGESERFCKSYENHWGSTMGFRLQHSVVQQVCPQIFTYNTYVHHIHLYIYNITNKEQAIFSQSWSYWKTFAIEWTVDQPG